MLSSKEALEMYHRVACYQSVIVDDSSHYETIKKDLDRLEKIKVIFEDMKDARDNASFQQDDEVFLTIFTELSHWCEQLKEVLENE